MPRQAPLAVGALAACAVIATGAILLRDQILEFSAWPDAREGRRAPDIVIPHVRAPAAGTDVASTPARPRAVLVRGAAAGIAFGGPVVLAPPGPAGPASAPTTSVRPVAAGGVPARPQGPSVTTT